MTSEGKYIYCIIASKDDRSFGSIGVGGRKDEVLTVGYEELRMVSSRHPVAKITPTRDNLLAHSSVIEVVMKEFACVLPFRFGIIAGDDQIREILKKEYNKFKKLLDKLNNKKELGVKAIFNEEAIYKHILEKHKDIHKLKMSIVSLPAEKTRSQRMKIGEMVEAALREEVETLKKDILSILSPLATEVKINKTFGERMIVNAAFLVEKDKEEVFYCRVNDIDVKHKGKMNLKYVCEVSPFNFVNLTINA
jgi:vacuolar-type H+-ATPase subunit F/Vma7